MLGNLTRVKIAGQLHITQILFMDDILIFVKAFTSKANCMDQILKIFSSSTSMELNLKKSSIYFFHVPISLKPLILKLLPFPNKPTNACFKYLGFLLKANDYRIQDWQWPIDKIRKKVGHWYHMWISMARRLTLIKSAIEAISMCWMSLACIPKSILNSTRKIYFSYLQATRKTRAFLSTNGTHYASQRAFVDGE